MTINELKEERRVLKSYLINKMRKEDWYWVADAAIALQKIDAKLKLKRKK